MSQMNSSFDILFSSTARRTELNLGWLMAKPNGITGVPYDDCRIFTFVPIFPYDIALHLNSTDGLDKRPLKRLHQVVLQGGLEDGRRDYTAIFESLETEIRGMYYEFNPLSCSRLTTKPS